MNRTLVITGLLILAAGLLRPWLSKIPLGRLPGDFIITRPGFRFYLPLTSGLLISLVLSLLIWIFR